MNPTYLIYLAATYSCNTYGSGNYNESGECTTGASTATNSGLVDTGVSLWAGIGVGVLLIVIAIAILITTRKKKRRA